VLIGVEPLADHRDVRLGHDEGLHELVRSHGGERLDGRLLALELLHARGEGLDLALKHRCRPRRVVRLAPGHTGSCRVRIGIGRNPLRWRHACS
jgi:hypothetical protein